MRSLAIENDPLDKTDRRIITALLENARTSNAELARLVGLSAPSVADRIRRLEDAGVITGYEARIDPSALGLPLAAWLRIRPVPGRLHQVVDILQAMPEIAECDRVTGEDCFIARVHVRSVVDLERVIDRIIPYAMTNTAIIQSSPVERRCPSV